MRARLARVGPLPVGLLAATATTAAWIGLAVTTGLIFHLMAAAPPLAAAWAYRETGSRPRRGEVGLLIAVGGGMSAFGIVLLAAIGSPLDAAWFTTLTIVVGAGLGAWLAGGAGGRFWDSLPPCGPCARTSAPGARTER